MRYEILNQDNNLSLLQRLLAVRQVSDDPALFLNPRFADYRKDPFLLNDMNKGVERIINALKKQEKIMHPFLGEEVEIGLLPYIQAMLLARHLRGDLAEYPPFLMR